MKLISETIENVTPLILEEAGQRAYFIEGPFLQAELKNKNGRRYPIEVLEKEVTRYTNECINTKRALGELGHPDSPSINLDRVSHLIISLTQEGNDFIGRAKIMDTPFGKIVKNLIDENVQLGVSTRGLGTISNGLVNDDFYLATAADIVHDPSAPNAFVQGIMEGREWVWNNGALKERQVAALREQLKKAPKKKIAEKRIVESRVWSQFFKSFKLVEASEHKSEHPVGTIFPVQYNKKDYIARLARKELHGEEWRIETVTGSYLMSVGYKDMTEHRTDK